MSRGRTFALEGRLPIVAKPLRRGDDKHGQQRDDASVESRAQQRDSYELAALYGGYRLGQFRETLD